MELFEKQEEELCFKFGLRLGFAHQMVRDMIEVVKNYAIGDIPPDELLDQIKKYLN